LLTLSLTRCKIKKLKDIQINRSIFENISWIIVTSRHEAIWMCIWIDENLKLEIGSFESLSTFESYLTNLAKKLSKTTELIKNIKRSLRKTRKDVSNQNKRDVLAKKNNIIKS
jgi:hypothetical protein